jgi:hypothetical protein
LVARRPDCRAGFSRRRDFHGRPSPSPSPGADGGLHGYAWMGGSRGDALRWLRPISSTAPSGFSLGRTMRPRTRIWLGFRAVGRPAQTMGRTWPSSTSRAVPSLIDSLRAFRLVDCSRGDQKVASWRHGDNAAAATSRPTFRRTNQSFGAISLPNTRIASLTRSCGGPPGWRMRRTR